MNCPQCGHSIDVGNLLVLPTIATSAYRGEPIPLKVAAIEDGRFVLREQMLAPWACVGSWTPAGYCNFPACPGGHPDYTPAQHLAELNPASLSEWRPW